MELKDLFELSNHDIHISVYSDVKGDKVVWVSGVRLKNNKRCVWTEGENGMSMGEYSSPEKAYEAAFKLIESMKKKWSKG